MEIWEVYDAHRQKTGKAMVRGEGIPKGAYHLVIHVCVFNEAGQLLIQKRQPFKEGWSGLWDLTVGGSALKGEMSNEAAQRELLEEVGIAHDFTDIRPSVTMNFNFGFDDYYIVQKTPDIHTLTLQAEEVEAVKWATLEELLEWIDQGTFIPYHKSLIKLLFDLRMGMGAIIKDTK